MKKLPGRAEYCLFDRAAKIVIERNLPDVFLVNILFDNFIKKRKELWILRVLRGGVHFLPLSMKGLLLDFKIIK